LIQFGSSRGSKLKKKNARPENKSRLSDTQIRAKLDLRICYRRREKRVGGGGVIG
jgi:hypothetical protein